MNDIQKIKEFFSKPLDENKKIDLVKKLKEAITAAYETKSGETAIDIAQKQLDQLGAKYEMSGNKFKPFKVIYKPIGKSDDWYDKFDEIVYLFNLESAVKSSMNEASMLDNYEVDFFHTKANVYANIEIPSENPTFEDDIQIKGTGKTEEEAFEDLKRNYEKYKKTGISEAKGSHFKIGDVVELKNMPENLPYEIRNGIVDNKWEIIKVSKSGRSMYSDVMEDVFGYDIELLDKKLKYKMFVYPEDIKSSMNEAKEQLLYKDWDQFEKPSKIKVYLNNGKTLEITPLKLKGGKRVYDAILQAFIDDRFDITNKVIQGMTNNLSEAKEEDIIDTITMDIPLFLRMLEYSKEDASQDMDLHDVTEKAISLGKERGILQMDDYDEIIGTTEKVNEVNLKQAKLSSSEYQKAKKLKDFKASDWKWNADEDLYTKVNEAELTEAYVPSNIKEFAKRKGVSSLVNKVAGWAEKVGKGIRGGTAIGKDYSTLILDMTYQGSEIRINTDNDTVTLYDEPVNSFPEFKSVYFDNKEEDNGLEERIAEAFNKINEELCPAGKAYIKKRQAAGEKSSAYLSGRAVKVCKGQMSGKAKKK